MTRALLSAAIALLGVGIALADRAGTASVVVLGAAVLTAAAAVVHDASSVDPTRSAGREPDVHGRFTSNPLSGEGDFSRRP